MDRGIIALCNYVKRPLLFISTGAMPKLHSGRQTDGRFIVISNPKIKMTHLQSYKAGELINLKNVLSILDFGEK